MIRLIEKLLELNNYDKLKNEFEEIFLSHPNYPSLFALTDTLDLLAIENIAANVPKDQLLELPESFLALCKEKVVLVFKSEKNIKIVDQDEVKQTLSFDEFSSDWNGIIVAIEPNESKIIKDKKYDLNGLKYIFPLLSLVLLSVFMNDYTLFDFIFLGTTIAGLIVSVFIVRENFGIKNTVVSKWCTIGANVSCDSVIKSEKNNFIKGINFPELPLIFFSTSLLSVLLQPSMSSVFLGFLSVLSFPVLLFSFWIQKFQIKKWCVLCLIISFLITIQGVVWLSQNGFSLSFTSGIFVLFFVLLVSIYSIWKLIKPFIKDSIETGYGLKQMKKFKRNYSLFNFLSKEVPVLDGFEDLKSLNFGNKDAELHLSIIVSPSCGHCHKAFQESLALVSKFPERVFLRVLFNINPENNDNPYKVVVERLLMINKTEPSKITEAISDWHIKNLDLKQWTEKWNVNLVTMMVNYEIQKQYDWCLKNEFNYTPVKIVNGRLHPNEYDISELKYFLNEFAEESENLEKIIGPQNILAQE
ncbi:vitamin K epoxide reductase family protein [Flavobacterium sp. N502540]|uniref:vitamin K epoxide reductase family protein n=1 Tax=Flavobacterium sp. N502540 TaxID=2986838 RepID=UPI0022256360|nr:vitamin K epoxide reductase family protein [Flavobacterium sp. N502540]